MRVPEQRRVVYDRGMPVSVNLQTVQSRKLAAVRREVAPGEVGAALGKVWDFIRSQPGLWTDGHNIFVYQELEAAGRAETLRLRRRGHATFETAGEVHATETPRAKLP